MGKYSGHNKQVDNRKKKKQQDKQSIGRKIELLVLKRKSIHKNILHIFFCNLSCKYTNAAFIVA